MIDAKWLEREPSDTYVRVSDARNQLASLLVRIGENRKLWDKSQREEFVKAVRRSTRRSPFAITRQIKGKNLLQVSIRLNLFNTALNYCPPTPERHDNTLEDESEPEPGNGDRSSYEGRLYKKFKCHELRMHPALRLESQISLRNWIRPIIRQCVFATLGKLHAGTYEGSATPPMVSEEVVNEVLCEWRRHHQIAGASSQTSTEKKSDSP